MFLFLLFSLMATDMELTGTSSQHQHTLETSQNGRLIYGVERHCSSAQHPTMTQQPTQLSRLPTRSPLVQKPPSWLHRPRSCNGSGVAATPALAARRCRDSSYGRRCGRGGWGGRWARPQGVGQGVSVRGALGAESATHAHVVVCLEPGKIGQAASPAASKGMLSWFRWQIAGVTFSESMVGHGA